MTMPRIYPATTIIILSALAFALAGCDSAEKRWYAQRVTLTSFEQSVLQAHATGVLTDEELIAMDTGVRAARVWLDTAKAFLPDGGDTFEAYLASASAVVAQLSPLIYEPKGNP